MFYTTVRLYSITRYPIKVWNTPFKKIILISSHKFIYNICSGWQYLQNKLWHDYVEQSWLFMYWWKLTTLKTGVKGVEKFNHLFIRLLGPKYSDLRQKNGSGPKKCRLHIENTFGSYMNRGGNFKGVIDNFPHAPRMVGFVRS